MAKEEDDKCEEEEPLMLDAEMQEQDEKVPIWVTMVELIEESTVVNAETLMLVSERKSLLEKILERNK